MASERRRAQVARQIRERISHLLLYEMKDPRASFLTVTGVEVNADLSVAKVLWSVYGGESERSKVEALLEHAHGHLRTEVARAIQLRSAPQLVFAFDEGLQRAQRIEEILREVLPKESGPDQTDDRIEPRS